MDIDPLPVEVRFHIRTMNSIQKLFFSLGLVGKIERATHIDINRDGYIGGRPYYYPPQPAPCHKKKH